jgi:hypothetical protein
VLLVSSISRFEDFSLRGLGRGVLERGKGVLDERSTFVFQEPLGCAAWRVALGLASDVLESPPSSVDHCLDALVGCADAEGVERSLWGGLSDGQEFSADEEDDPPTSAELPSGDELEDEDDAEDHRAQQPGETTGASASASASASSAAAQPSTSSAACSSLAAPSGSSSSLALAPPLAATDRSAFARSLGIRESQKNNFLLLTGHMAVGTIYRIGPNGFKAICKVHGPKDCACYVSLKPGEEVEPVERVLMQWLSEAPGLSLSDHRAKATELKLARGMRIRSAK